MANLQTELQFAADLVREAGALTLQYFQQADVESDRKADDSPVTVADYESERLIREKIAASFPADGILGEEEGESAGTSGRRWTVDPIDGTKTFIQGVPLYSVLLGLEEGGEAVVGAIYIPGVDDLVVAARGEGCFWNGSPTSVSDVSDLSDAFLVYTSCNNFYRAGGGGEQVLERLIPACREMRSWGDAYGYVLVATGRADVMLDPLINPWDLVPLLPVIHEAGGSITDWTGKSPPPGAGWPNCVATNGGLEARVLDLLKV